MNSKIIQVKNVETAKANAPQGTRFIHTMSIMDDSAAGGFWGFYATPSEEREYNDGMASLAELFG